MDCERWDGGVEDTWRTDLELLEFAKDGVEGAEIGCFCGLRGDKCTIDWYWMIPRI